MEITWEKPNKATLLCALKSGQKRWLYETYAETQDKMAEKAGKNLELLETLQRVKSWAGGNRSSHLFHSDGFSCFTPPSIAEFT